MNDTEPKLVCHIGSSRDWIDSERSASDWFFVNERAHDLLSTVKTSIGNDHRWDRCKKYFNAHELISSSALDAPSCSAYAPTSRSFFKLIELLQDHHEDLTIQHACKVAFLCDAPGGFVEAFLVYRRRRGNLEGWIGKDILHAISLVSSTDSVPAWRIPREMLRNNNVHLHGGDAGNNGDLYQIRNIDDFVERVGAHSCELVTADGGFDFSGDFNCQERSSLRLLVSEVYTALRTVADGGAFLVKMYDMKLPATIRMMWHLHCCFSGGLVIDKPHTSRAANSEKYLICRWFDRTARVDKLVELLRVSVCRGLGEVPLVRGGRHLPPAWFLRELALFNIRYITHQTRVIMDTLAHMRSSDTMFPYLQTQITIARSWCVRYGIALSPCPSIPCPTRSPNAPNSVQASPDHPVTVACPLGTAVTHSPVRCRSRSPSATPYKDGLLFPGR